jgi:DNA-binding HxlR family transcriptional regulator
METHEMVFDVNKDPYNHMARILFGRWKPFLLMAMVFDEGTTNFSDFIKQLPISHKVLSENLKAMEADGLIYRTVVPGTPPRTEYRLTETGLSMVPLLRAVYDAGWQDMTRKGMPIDALGEMWHGYRERDDRLMYRVDGKKT